MASRMRFCILGTGGVDDPESPFYKEKVKKMIAGVEAKFAAAGADTHIYYMPTGGPGVIEDFRKTIREQPNFDAFTIGYGVRGNKEKTALFEELINTAITENGKAPRFVFPISPAEVFEDACRVFPQLQAAA